TRLSARYGTCSYTHLPALGPEARPAPAPRAATWRPGGLCQRRQAAEALPGGRKPPTGGAKGGTRLPVGRKGITPPARPARRRRSRSRTWHDGKFDGRTAARLGGEATAPPDLEE